MWDNKNPLSVPYFQHKGACVEKKDLRASTSVGLARENPALDPLSCTTH